MARSTGGLFAVEAGLERFSTEVPQVQVAPSVQLWHQGSMARERGRKVERPERIRRVHEAQRSQFCELELKTMRCHPFMSCAQKQWSACYSVFRRDPTCSTKPVLLCKQRRRVDPQDQEIGSVDHMRAGTCEITSCKFHSVPEVRGRGFLGKHTSDPPLA